MYIYDNEKWIGTNIKDISDIGEAIAAWVYKRNLWNDEDSKVFLDIVYRLINEKDLLKSHIKHLSIRMFEYYHHKWNLTNSSGPRYIRNGIMYRGVKHDKLVLLNTKLASLGWYIPIEDIMTHTAVPNPNISWMNNIDNSINNESTEAISECRLILMLNRSKRIETDKIHA